MGNVIVVKLILIPLVIGLVVVYFARIRTQLLDSLVVVLIAGVGIAFVISPELANELAHLVGVGRGADLLMYTGLIGVMFLLILIYARLRELEAYFTQLARDIAVSRAVLFTGNETTHTPAADAPVDVSLSGERT
jgi:hypothetical protein